MLMLLLLRRLLRAAKSKWRSPISFGATVTVGSKTPSGSHGESPLTSKISRLKKSASANKNFSAAANISFKGKSRSDLDFRPGQRWVSESEPELGLGSIVSVTDRRVAAVFGATGQKREYARLNAPLRRVHFRVGDSIRTRDDAVLTVESVTERNGLLYYGSGKRELCETELSDAISFNEPEERLFAGQFDPPAIFDLRVQALRHEHGRRKSNVRGFAGGRIDLIPHQLYI